MRLQDGGWKYSRPAGEKWQSQIPGSGETFLSWFSAKLSPNAIRKEFPSHWLTLIYLRASYQQIFFPQENSENLNLSRPRLVACFDSDQWLHYVDLFFAPFFPPDSLAACLEHTCQGGPGPRHGGLSGRNPHQTLTLPLALPEGEVLGDAVVISPDFCVGQTRSGNKKLLSRLGQKSPDRRSSLRKDSKSWRPGESEEWWEILCRGVHGGEVRPNRGWGSDSKGPWKAP